MRKCAGLFRLASPLDEQLAPEGLIPTLPIDSDCRIFVFMGEKAIAPSGRPIKILRILGRINVGGPAVHAVLLTEGLNNQKLRSTLVTGTVGKSEGDMLYFAHQHGVQPVIVPELGREISWRDDLVAFWKLYRIFRKECPDIVHTHTAKAGTLGRIAAVFARVPIRIHTFHGHIFHHYFGPLRTRLFILIERLLALFTMKIIAISNAQLTDLSVRYRIAAQDKFRVIPIGLDLSPLLQSRGRDRSRGPTPDDRETVIGFIGRLVPVKNPQMALRVFERVVRHGAMGRIRLVVAGDGELRLKLQAEVTRAGLDGRVLFTGWRQDLSKLYSDLDLVIVTSLNEGTPVVLIEAMASGLPFVATRVGGIMDLMLGPEQVVRGPEGRSVFSVFANGVLAEPADEQGFAAALEYLLRDPALMVRMGSEGRQFVRDRFSTERLLADIQTLYRDCLVQQEGLHVERAGRTVRA